jgi:hypothetical protein
MLERSHPRSTNKKHRARPFIRWTVRLLADDHEDGQDVTSILIKLISFRE